MNRTPQEAADFIRAHTAALTVPFAPEITLYQATEVTPIWRATEEWLQRQELPPPYWAFPWAGGQAIARYLLDHPDFVRGKRVLDFASGSGVCGIAAVMAGARQVTVTDIDPFAIQAILLNAALNGVSIEVLLGDLTGQEITNHDVIVAGDICYQQGMAFGALEWLRSEVRRGMTVVLGDPGRAYFPKTGIMHLATYDIPVTLELEDNNSRTTKVAALLGSE